jgi:hypothetical protein
MSASGVGDGDRLQDRVEHSEGPEIFGVMRPFIVSRFSEFSKYFGLSSGDVQSSSASVSWSDAGWQSSSISQSDFSIFTLRVRKHVENWLSFHCRCPFIQKRISHVFQNKDYVKIQVGENIRGD